VNWQNVRTNGRKFATPQLDRMAADGLRFTRHYCAAPVCAPARASLLLGVHQGHANVRDSQFDKELENNHTLGTVMQQAGYATAVIGKWGLAGSGSLPGHPLNRGFDFYFGHINHGEAHRHYPTEGGVSLLDGSTNVGTKLHKCYSTDLWTARAKHWITNQRASDASRPFFLYLAYTTPHAQLQVPTQAYPSGGGLNGGVQWLGIDNDAATPTINTATGTIDSWIHPDYAYAVDSGGTAWPNHAKRYATKVRRLDDAVGDLIQLLEDLGIDDQTLIVLSSDNGPHNASGSGGSITNDPRFFASWGPLDGMKRDIWEGGVRMPTLARWPAGIPAGIVADEPSQAHDWLPTFCELAGLPAPARSDGVSLVPTLTGVGTQRESLVYTEFYEGGSTPNFADFESWRRGLLRREMQFAYIGRYKGVRANIQNATSSFRIYDTLNDPKETVDLAGVGIAGIPAQGDFERLVLQSRRAGGGVSRPYDSAVVPASAPTDGGQGLACHAFAGEYPWVPDFNAQVPVATSFASLPTLAAGASGLRYSGWLDVPATGDWSFSLNTDGAAVIRLNRALLIDADRGYLSGTIRSSGTIPLQAGRHWIEIHCIRRAVGGTAFDFRWSGPQLAEQAVPASAYFLDSGEAVIGLTAQNDSVQSVGSVTAQGEAVRITALANDSGSSLEIQSVGSAAGGAVKISGDELVYTPRRGFFGVDQFPYTITDGEAKATAVVTVMVIARDEDRWYPMDEDSGFIVTDAGGGRQASLIGFQQDPWIVGRHGSAIGFDGVDDAILVSGDDGISGTQPRTLAAWIRTTATGDMPVIAWGPTTSGMKWNFMVQTGVPRIEVSGGYKQLTKIVNDGQWHHIACVWENDGTPDVTDTRFYIDGVLETSVADMKSTPINTGGGVELRIGSDIQGRFFAGAIDDVRINSRALSASEIASLYGMSSAEVDTEAWSYRNLGMRSLAPADWLADLDGDGHSVRLEYALGGSPHVADPRLLPELERINGGWNFLYNRRVVSGASAYAVEWSPDLKAPWIVLSGDVVLPHATLPGFERVRMGVPGQSGDSGFLRLRVR